VTVHRALTWALPTTAVLALAACGGGTAARGPARDTASHGIARSLTGGELASQLANGFRGGLYRLAVMSQPGDDAADLGQQLPTGTLRAVSCRPAAASRSTWSCAVRWETVDGRPSATRYRVSVNRSGCFYGAAHPPLPEHYDATIRTYSEHPLNALQSLRRGC
jgi:hypothetical protein